MMQQERATAVVAALERAAEGAPRPIFGTVMINRFSGSLDANAPPAITEAVPADRMSALNNAQILMPQVASSA